MSTREIASAGGVYEPRGWHGRLRSLSEIQKDLTDQERGKGVVTVKSRLRRHPGNESGAR